MEFLFPLLILLLFIPIFLSGRKQRRQVKEMQELQTSLEVGDVVVTTSGLRGTVVDASYEDTIDLEIADDVVTTWVRAAVREKVTVPDVVVEETPADDLIGSAPVVEPAASERVGVESGDVTPSLIKDTTATPASESDANGTARS